MNMAEEKLATAMELEFYSDSQPDVYRNGLKITQHLGE